MKRAARPLWCCPKCGKYYVTRNVWHACAHHTLQEHFARKDPKLKLLFDGLVGLVRRNGPLRVVPGKTGIAFQVRMRFGGAVVRKDRIEAGFVLPRRLEEPRIKRVIAYSPRAYGHHVDVRSPADLDDELAGWLREAYRVGRQIDLLSGRRAPPRTPGEFSWSESLFPHGDRAARGAGSGNSRPRKSAPKRRSPPWTCPKCGRSFLIRNQMHICSNLSVEEALRGKSTLAIALFRRLRAMSRECGPVKIFPQKTRFAFEGRRCFLGVRLLRNAIECEFNLPRRIEHPRFRQILSVSPRSHYHYLRIFSEKEFGRDVRAWLREAYTARVNGSGKET